MRIDPARLSASEQLRRSARQRRLRKLVGHTIIYAVMIGLACIFMLPIFWMASTSLKLPRELMAWPPEWIPSNPQWGNYAEAFGKYPLGRYMLNSAILVIRQYRRGAPVGAGHRLWLCPLQLPLQEHPLHFDVEHDDGARAYQIDSAVRTLLAPGFDRHLLAAYFAGLFWQSIFHLLDDPIHANDSARTGRCRAD